MEVDFNPTRIPKAEFAQPVTSPGLSRPVSGSDTSSVTKSLQCKLSDVQAIRQDKVALGKSLLSQTKYPPDYVLERIAVLLAIHHKP